MPGERDSTLLSEVFNDRAVKPRALDPTLDYRFGSGTVTVGDAGDAQFKINEQADSFTFESGSNANVFTPRLEFFSADHANASDIAFYKADGTTVSLLWDQSDDRWEFAAAPTFAGTAILLADGTVDSTGTQRFTGTPTPVVFGAAGDTQFSIVEDVDFFTINVGNNADVFLQRFVFFSSDHATSANDIQLRDGASANALLWDNSLDVWRMFKPLWVRDVLPETDVTYDLGSASATWVDLFVDNIKDRAGATPYDVQNATFGTAHTFSAQARFTAAPVPVIYGAAGDAQFEFLEAADGWILATGSNANVFTTRITFNTADHANAHDIAFATGAGGNALWWDNSLDVWRMFKDLWVRDVRAEADNTYDLGTAAVSWRDLYLYTLKDEAGNTVFDTSAAGVNYTLNATAVLDRTLLASASATTTNNNNVLAALITDLISIGILT